MYHPVLVKENNTASAFRAALSVILNVSGFTAPLLVFQELGLCFNGPLDISYSCQQIYGLLVILKKNALPWLDHYPTLLHSGVGAKIFVVGISFKLNMTSCPADRTVIELCFPLPHDANRRADKKRFRENQSNQYTRIVYLFFI